MGLALMLDRQKLNNSLYCINKKIVAAICANRTAKQRAARLNFEDCY